MRNTMTNEQLKKIIAKSISRKQKEINSFNSWEEGNELRRDKKRLNRFLSVIA